MLENIGQNNLKAELDRDSDQEQELEAVAFVGEALAPFFLQDPRTGDAAAAFDAMASLDVDAAAAEWPFVKLLEAQRCLSLMQRGASSWRTDDDLMWEYRRLFIGPGKKPAPPWGSVYTDKECVVFGESTLALRFWMRDRGIARIADDRSPEDHIGLMLTLMAWIACNRPGILDEFLQLHLLTWSSHFLEQLSQAAEHPFYKGLACLTDATLEGIRQLREIAVDYPKFYR